MWQSFPCLLATRWDFNFLTKTFAWWHQVGRAHVCTAQALSWYPRRCTKAPPRYFALLSDSNCALSLVVDSSIASSFGRVPVFHSSPATARFAEEPIQLALIFGIGPFPWNFSGQVLSQFDSLEFVQLTLHDRMIDRHHQLCSRVNVEFIHQRGCMI